MRRISILPFLVGVFCLLSFTEGQGETRFVMNEKENPNVIPDSGVVDTAAISGILGLNNNSTKIDCKIDDMSYLKEEEMEKGIIDASKNLGLAIDELEKTIKTKNQASRLLSLQKAIELLELKYNEVGIGKNQINEQFCASVTNEDLLKTRIDFIQLKKEMDALKLEKNKQVKTNKFSHLALRMFQTNLVSKIYQAQMGGLTTMLQDMMTPMLKTMGNAMENMSSGMKENPEKDTNISEEIEEPNVEENKYHIKPSQVTVSQLPYSNVDNEIQIVSIEKKPNEVRVTIAVSISSDNAWVCFDKGFTLIDKRNQDRYIIRRLEGNLPLNQKIWVSGYAYKALEFTLVFPPLKKSVDMISIVEFLSEEDGASGVGFRSSNFLIKDYLKKTSAKVYK